LGLSLNVTRAGAIVFKGAGVKEGRGGGKRGRKRNWGCRF